MVHTAIFGNSGNGHWAQVLEPSPKTLHKEASSVQNHQQADGEGIILLYEQHGEGYQGPQQEASPRAHTTGNEEEQTRVQLLK